jgi:hypothetical protein
MIANLNELIADTAHRDDSIARKRRGAETRATPARIFDSSRRG